MGLVNGQPSRFNSRIDLAPLARLLGETGLVDATATESPEFTIERRRPGLLTQFRCDLVLVPDGIHPVVDVRYDHLSRTGQEAFTDHSGILIDIPAL